MGQRTLVLIIGVVVFVLAATVPLVQYESFLLLIGSIFVPLLGILTADYFVLQGRQYSVTELYTPGGSYWYQAGTNWTAIVVWFLGVVLYLVITGLPQLGLPGLAPWLGATLPTYLFGFVAYAIVRSLIRRSTPARAAA
jgi:NCS1 family nucleobase:cation symporter-1